MRSLACRRLLFGPAGPGEGNALNRKKCSAALLALALMLVTACTSAPERRAVDSASQEPSAPRPTLEIIVRAEMASLAAKPVRTFGLGGRATASLFNRGLTFRDDRGQPALCLAEALPQLNTESWRVFPDGRMETTYRLRPNLRWHDGVPLSAEDFVFGWQVYSIPDLGYAASAPNGHIDTVLAPDAHTLVIRWRVHWVEAGALDATGETSFPALPRHILSEAFRQANWDAFGSLPYWSAEYIAEGPFRLDHWELGAFMEAVAFPGYALGRPKIDRIRITPIPDANAVVASMLARRGHITVDSPIQFQQGLILRQEWAPSRAGSVLVYPAFWRWTYVQQRPEMAQPRSLTDPRIRRALTHTVDKDALNQAIFEGEGIMTVSPIPPTSSAFPLVDAAAVKYAYDPRWAEQFMADAGYRRGADGTFTSPIEGRFSTELTVITGPQNQAELSIVGAGWRHHGFDIREVVWSTAQGSDAQLRAIHPGLATTNGIPGHGAVLDYRSSMIPRPENRWSGSNRGAWSHGEFDRLAESFSTSLDTSQRHQLLASMVRIMTEDAAVISYWFNPQVTAFVAGLTGPRATDPDSNVAWNVHEWELT